MKVKRIGYVSVTIVARGVGFAKADREISLVDWLDWATGFSMSFGVEDWFLGLLESKDSTVREWFKGKAILHLGNVEKEEKRFKISAIIDGVIHDCKLAGHESIPHDFFVAIEGDITESLPDREVSAGDWLPV